MVAVVIQGARVLYRINKDEGDESLPFYSFLKTYCPCNFSETFKERQIILEPCSIRNIPSYVFYDVTEHYQVQSQHRRTQNTFKDLRWCVFVQIVNTLNSLTRYAKNSILDV